MNSTHDIIGMYNYSLCKNTSFVQSTANVIGKILMQLCIYNNNKLFTSHTRNISMLTACRVVKLA